MQNNNSDIIKSESPPESEKPSIDKIIKNLKSKNGLIRQEARVQLVSMGGKVIEDIAELLTQPRKRLRWEAAKAFTEIAHPGSIPHLIAALYDKDEDVRWLAAEGLIAVGKASITPLLQELINNPSSLLLRNGTHHVLIKLSRIHNLLQFNNLILILSGKKNAEIHVPVEAMKILDAMTS